MTMKQLSDQIIYVGKEENKGVSNLQLQKVLYFVIADYIKENGIDSFIKNIYDEKMEAWQYGPVLRTQYFDNKIFGSMNIRKKVKYNEKLKVFDEFIKGRINDNLGDLIDESHNHPKWKENEKAIMNQEKVFYELEDFEDVFQSE